MTLVVYGLKNCDTCRKARKMLTESNIEHSFKDLRIDGFADEDLKRWLKVAGWEKLLNKRGTTWRGLAEDTKENTGLENIQSLLTEFPALMKRPIFDFGTKVVVGFSKKEQLDLL